MLMVISIKLNFGIYVILGRRTRQWNQRYILPLGPYCRFEFTEKCKIGLILYLVVIVQVANQ